jgi:hypothetical protein
MRHTRVYFAPLPHSLNPIINLWLSTSVFSQLDNSLLDSKEDILRKCSLLHITPSHKKRLLNEITREREIVHWKLEQQQQEEAERGVECY